MSNTHSILDRVGIGLEGDEEKIVQCLKQSNGGALAQLQTLHDVSHAKCGLLKFRKLHHAHAVYAIQTAQLRL